MARAYGKRYLARASLVAYGSVSDVAEHNDKSPLCISDPYSDIKHNLSHGNYFLILGRAEPENNFEMMIKAFCLPTQLILLSLQLSI